MPLVRIVMSLILTVGGFVGLLISLCGGTLLLGGAEVPGGHLTVRGFFFGLVVILVGVAICGLAIWSIGLLWRREK